MHEATQYHGHPSIYHKQSPMGVRGGDTLLAAVNGLFFVARRGYLIQPQGVFVVVGTAANSRRDAGMPVYSLGAAQLYLAHQQCDIATGAVRLVRVAAGGSLAADFGDGCGSRVVWGVCVAYLPAGASGGR